jgi:hypothetical protein
VESTSTHRGVGFHRVSRWSLWASPAAVLGPAPEFRAYCSKVFGGRAGRLDVERCHEWLTEAFNRLAHGAPHAAQGRHIGVLSEAIPHHLRGGLRRPYFAPTSA